MKIYLRILFFLIALAMPIIGIAELNKPDSAKLAEYSTIQKYVKNDRDYFKALALLKPLAQSHDPYALYILSSIYKGGDYIGPFTGEKTDNDYDKMGMKMLIESASLGYLPAISNVVAGGYEEYVEPTVMQEYVKKLMAAPPSGYFVYFYLQMGFPLSQFPPTYNKKYAYIPELSEQEIKHYRKLAMDYGYCRAAEFDYHEKYHRYKGNKSKEIVVPANVQEAYYYLLIAEDCIPPPIILANGFPSLPHAFLHTIVNPIAKPTLKKKLTSKEIKEAEAKFAQCKKNKNNLNWYDYYQE